MARQRDSSLLTADGPALVVLGGNRDRGRLRVDPRPPHPKHLVPAQRRRGEQPHGAAVARRIEAVDERPELLVAEDAGAFRGPLAVQIEDQFFGA